MSKSQRNKVDVQFVLPKKRSATINLSEEDPSKITKTIGLHIEDFLEKIGLKEERRHDSIIIKSPPFFIRDQPLVLNIRMPNCDCCPADITLDVSTVNGEWKTPILKSIGVTGICGDLTFKENNNGDRDGYFYVDLGPSYELKEAMTSSGNRKLDLQVTVTGWGEAEAATEWIIPR